MPPPRSSSLKKGSELKEDEKKVTKERKSGQSRVEKALERAKIQSAHSLSAKGESIRQKSKTRSLPRFPF